MTMKLLGYFTDNKTGTPESAQDVFIALDEGYKRITIYSPTEQHSEGDRGYLDECIEITKEQYKEVSKIFYTPQEYLEFDSEDEEEEEAPFYTLAWMKADCTMDSNHMPEHMVAPCIQALKNSGVKEESIFVFKQFDNQREKFSKSKGDDQA